MVDIYKERIKPLFDKTGLLNKDLEAEIGIPEKKISDWNAGRLKSYDKYIPQIASYFHVSTDYLLGSTDDPTPVGQKESPAADPGSGTKYPPGYELLTPENRAKADSYLAFLLAEQQNGQT